MTQISSRIIQRHDELSNWVSNNIVLLDGELAVVGCGDCTRFKIGNGLSTFNQLPFVDQNVLSTKVAYANAMSQGIHAKSSPFGLAAGAYVSADANFSQAFGYDAKALASDQYSFVWNGNDLCAIGDAYESHGPGSFSINPKSGIDGVYIGDQTLPDSLSSAGFAMSSDIPTDLSSLSNSPGYVISSDLTSTLGSIQKSLIAQIEAPKASVNSILCALTQLLSILSGQNG